MNYSEIDNINNSNGNNMTYMYITLLKKFLYFSISDSISSLVFWIHLHLKSF